MIAPAAERQEQAPTPPTVFEVWKGRDYSWSVWELRTLMTKGELKEHFQALGFVFPIPRNGRLCAGPCSECGDRVDAGLVDSHGRCPGCRPIEGCPKLAREREAAVRRLRAREQAGDPLRRVYFRVSNGAVNPMGARVGTGRRRSAS